MFSDAQLQLLPRWFTGAQWADGTAETELQIEYEQATEKLKQSRARRHDDKANKERFREVSGLPPVLAVKRLMGRY